MKRVTLSVVVMAACSLWSVPAGAQTPQRSSPPKNGLQIGVGVRWNSEVTFASSDANELAPSGSTVALFTAQSRLESAFGVQVSVSPRLNRSMRLEVTGAYAAPQLSVAVVDDLEGADSVVASETIQQILLEVAIVAEHDGMNPSRRTVPFTFAGVGFAREMHEGQTLIENSQGYFVGIGGKHFLMRGRVRRNIGVREDVRIVFRVNGASFDDKIHVGATVGASLFFQF
jgi:hypothetical protein